MEASIAYIEDPSKLRKVGEVVQSMLLAEVKSKEEQRERGLMQVPNCYDPQLTFDFTVQKCFLLCGRFRNNRRGINGFRLKSNTDESGEEQVNTPSQVRWMGDDEHSRGEVKSTEAKL
jgi:hypothetical protein